MPAHPTRSGLLTDLYELTMAAAYWQSGMQRDVATFELSIRSLPPTLCRCSATFSCGGAAAIARQKSR